MKVIQEGHRRERGPCGDRLLRGPRRIVGQKPAAGEPARGVVRHVVGEVVSRREDHGQAVRDRLRGRIAEIFLMRERDEAVGGEVGVAEVGLGERPGHVDAARVRPGNRPREVGLRERPLDADHRQVCGLRVGRAEPRDRLQRSLHRMQPADEEQERRVVRNAQPLAKPSPSGVAVGERRDVHGPVHHHGVVAGHPGPCLVAGPLR